MPRRFSCRRFSGVSSSPGELGRPSGWSNPRMAGLAGFEPTVRESNSRALPLGYSPVCNLWFRWDSPTADYSMPRGDLQVESRVISLVFSKCAPAMHVARAHGRFSSPFVERAASPDIVSTQLPGIAAAKTFAVSNGTTRRFPMDLDYPLRPSQVGLQGHFPTVFSRQFLRRRRPAGSSRRADAWFPGPRPGRTGRPRRREPCLRR